VVSFKISVKDDFDLLKKKLTTLEKKQLPFAYSRALTWVAQDVKIEEYATMNRVFKYPTTYVVPKKWSDPKTKAGSLFLQPAKKKDPTPEAFVKVKDLSLGNVTPAIKFIDPNIHGGMRSHKGFEKNLIRKGLLRGSDYLAPARDAKLNRFGNISKGKINQILSSLQAQRDSSANSPSSSSNRQRYFMMYKNGQPTGIWERSGKKSIKKVFNVIRQPYYRKILPFYRVGMRVVKNSFSAYFRVSMNRAIKTAFR
jgi:hypothetical protein